MAWSSELSRPSRTTPSVGRCKTTSFPALLTGGLSSSVKEKRQERHASLIPQLMNSNSLSVD
ncbi:mCG1050936 [Mus musculus]|nr:mCG1050936 [Mus musculus]